MFNRIKEWLKDNINNILVIFLAYIIFFMSIAVLSYIACWCFNIVWSFKIALGVWCIGSILKGFIDFKIQFNI